MLYLWETKLETMKTIISNRWKYEINIKALFEDKTTPELVVKLCDSLSNQLESIYKRVEGGDLKEDEIDYLSNELEDSIDKFGFLKELSNGDIKESEWNNFGFDGNFNSYFNGLLEQLYDLADQRVVTKENVSEKFIWIH